jgi:hypothetical protein
VDFPGASGPQPFLAGCTATLRNFTLKDDCRDRSNDTYAGTKVYREVASANVDGLKKSIAVGGAKDVVCYSASRSQPHCTCMRGYV